MYNFKLEPDQIEKFESWKNEQKKKDSRTATAGERWTFSFTPSGLGLVVIAKDELLEEEIDLTDWENW